MSPKVDARLNGICTPRIYIFNSVLSAPNRYRMQKLHPREVDISTTPIGAHKPFGVSSLGVWISDV
jgi:hypothetical protein